MKLVFGNKYKTVSYFGIDLIVADYIKFIVTNSRGEVYGSKDEPELDHQNGWLYDYYAFSDYIASVDLEGMDWKDTLMEVG
jgi:hypothetical protein